MPKTILKFVPYSVLSVLLLLQVATVSAELITPSHIYQVTEDILSEIDILRESIGVDDEPKEPEPQRSKSPIHVYSKGLEVLEKISKAERKLGMFPTEVGEIPLREIKPEDALEITKKILLQLQSMKEQLYIKDQIEAAQIVGGKMYAQVYENLWLASYMLDGLTPPIKSKDVFRNLQYLENELRLIATNLGVSPELKAPDVKGRKRLKEVGQQALLALYKVSDLENRFSGMTAASVPNITLVRISSSDIYDLTNILMAEMVRIKVHLKIDLPRGSQPTPGRVRTNEVFAQMRLVVINLEKIIKVVAEKNK